MFQSPANFIEDARSDMGLGIRASIRGLWSGKIDQFSFIDSMVVTLDRNLRRAWDEGLAQAGIAPGEMSDAEQDALMALINGQFQYLPPFSQVIVNSSKANGGKLGPLLQRGELWLGRYDEAVVRAKTMASGNKKMRWTLHGHHVTKKPCSSCLRLNGKVKRANFWHEKGILPRVAGCWWLICKGYRCGCDLIETNEPLSKGPLPSLP